MQPDALTKDDQPVWAGQFTAEEWDALKAQSQAHPTSFKMPCCHARAVLKTSINGLPFFAHHTDECATAPETIWHIEAKDLLFGALTNFGMNPRTEVSGGTGKDRWRADLYFEIDGRKIAIELQRSPQTLRKFEDRQARYARHNIECYWLVRLEVGLTLMRAIYKKRRAEDLNRDMLANGHMLNSTPDFFFGVLAPGLGVNVKCPGYAASHVDLVVQIMTRELQWDGKKWGAVSLA